MLYGTWRISKLPQPVISIFGGSRLKLDTPYARKAQQLSIRLIEQNISILTGGGPGIMEAASCGTQTVEKNKRKGRVLGIGVSSLGEEANKCADEYFELEFFFARKWLLTEYSTAFVVFPGGFGTLDELAGVLTLIQTQNLKRVPVLLIGKEYWADFIQWLEKEPLEHGFIFKEDIEFFKITDDLDDAFCWIMGKCELL
jgi:uncharacterized protein (TIGR00730 family)